MTFGVFFKTIDKKDERMISRFIISVFVFSLFPIANAQDSIPALNRKIVDYVSTTIGTQVNRGECWDLAYEALKRNEAMWDWEYEYGELIDPANNVIYPGDLIQFEGVETKYKTGNMTITETMEHHTAIVYRVIDQERKIFEIAHQNNQSYGRKVGLDEFNLGNVTKGKVMFYRPVPLE